MLQHASAVTAGHRREKKLEFVDTNVNFTSITALISTFANDCVIIQTYKSLHFMVKFHHAMAVLHR